MVELAQRTAISAFRCVENRISIIRSVNTGISCLIERYLCNISHPVTAILPMPVVVVQFGGKKVSSLDKDSSVISYASATTVIPEAIESHWQLQGATDVAERLLRTLVEPVRLGTHDLGDSFRLRLELTATDPKTGEPHYYAGLDCVVLERAE